MVAKRSLIIDLSGNQTPCCLIDGENLFKPQLIKLNIPLKVIAFEENDKFQILSGESADLYQADEDSLIFYNLIEDLPAIKDGFVQTELIKSFWASLCNMVSKRFYTILDGKTTGCIVYPRQFGVGLLETIRLSCAQTGQIENIIFISESAALILGLFYSNLLKLNGIDLSADEKTSAHTICAVNGYDPQNFEVVCFDYSSPEKNSHRIVIRDYFQTSSDHLPDRLQRCKWTPEADFHFLLDLSNFKGTDHRKLRARLLLVIPKIQSKTDSFEDSQHFLPFLKSLGASYIARCCLAEAKSLPQFELINQTNIGIRIDRKHFYPILRNANAGTDNSYPNFSAKSFIVSGTFENDLELSIHTGYSNLIEESSLLGNLTVASADLMRLTGRKKTDLVAIACLNAPGEGDLTLGLAEDNQIIGRLSFVLPGLVC